MIVNIFSVLLISVLLNWCVSLQILAQTEKENRTRIVAIVMSLIIGAIVGLIAIR